MRATCVSHIKHANLMYLHFNKPPKALTKLGSKFTYSSLNAVCLCNVVVCVHQPPNLKEFRGRVPLINFFEGMGWIYTCYSAAETYCASWRENWPLKTIFCTWTNWEHCKRICTKSSISRNLLPYSKGCADKKSLK